MPLPSGGNGRGHGKPRMCRRRAGSGTDCGGGGVPRKGRGARRCAALFRPDHRRKERREACADGESVPRSWGLRPEGGPARSGEPEGTAFAGSAFFTLPASAQEGVEPHCRAPIARVELPRPPFSRWREQRPMGRRPEACRTGAAGADAGGFRCARGGGAFRSAWRSSGARDTAEGARRISGAFRRPAPKAGALGAGGERLSCAAWHGPGGGCRAGRRCRGGLCGAAFGVPFRMRDKTEGAALAVSSRNSSFYRRRERRGEAGSAGLGAGSASS